MNTDTTDPTPDTQTPTATFPNPGSIAWDEYIEANENALEPCLVQAIRELSGARAAVEGWKKSHAAILQALGEASQRLMELTEEAESTTVQLAQARVEIEDGKHLLRRCVDAFGKDMGGIKERIEAHITNRSC